MSGYRGPDAERALAAALVDAAARAGIVLTIVNAIARPWESATFSGARHILNVELEGEAQAIETWLAALPEHDFEVGRHIVADISVSEGRQDGATIEALTVADR